MTLSTRATRVPCTRVPEKPPHFDLAKKIKKNMWRLVGAVSLVTMSNDPGTSAAGIIVYICSVAGKRVIDHLAFGLRLLATHKLL